MQLSSSLNKHDEVVFVRFYNFDSDNESHINGDELSDLSDVIDDDFVGDDPQYGHNEHCYNTKSDVLPTEESMLSLDDIPYDRDLKWINVPNGSRPKPTIATNNRLFKQVGQITSANAKGLKELDEHYKRMDVRKTRHDSQSRISKKDSNTASRTLFEVNTDERQHSGADTNGRYSISGQEGRTAGCRTTGAKKLLGRPAPVDNRNDRAKESSDDDGHNERRGAGPKTKKDLHHDRQSPNKNGRGNIHKRDGVKSGVDGAELHRNSETQRSKKHHTGSGLADALHIERDSKFDSRGGRDHRNSQDNRGERNWIGGRNEDKQNPRRNSHNHTGAASTAIAEATSTSSHLSGTVGASEHVDATPALSKLNPKAPAFTPQFLIHDTNTG